jgi:hypothetical protein
MEWKAFHMDIITKMDICVNNRHIYKENVADIDVAKYFSHETMVPEISGIIPFTFHKWSGSNSKYQNFKIKI